MAEDVNEWFNLQVDSPYMQYVAKVQPKHCKPLPKDQEMLLNIDHQLKVPRSDIPAVTHVDYSARIQTVHEEANQRYYYLLKAFKQATGCPVLINTSFNVRGEPIVCTPEDAFRCFMGTELDILVINNCILMKEDQPARMKLDYKDHFSPD